MWPKTISLLLILGLNMVAQAQVDVDRTCATCSRRINDSLNIKVGNIRLNQVGYLPRDPDKSAFFADPIGTSFSILDATTHTVVYTGTLKSLGAFTEGAMKIRGGYNSITDLYSMSRPAASVNLFRGDFPDFKIPGHYILSNGKDTSERFQIDPKVYNFVFETSLKFFGSQRCGNTQSWMHAACHKKDGDALGPEFSGKLSGGWHDCGDHGKYASTQAYAALTLALTYALWPQKGEDFYGPSYNDTLPFGTDGIPDVLYEAKVGADYILKLYQASKAKGLLDKGDMYHTVGNFDDHSYWDVPEKQDAQPTSKGGPARPVSSGIGSNVAGAFASALALFAWGWEPFDPVYAHECLAAAQDIYKKIVIGKRGTTTLAIPGYTGGGQTKDDEAMAALSLWFATKDSSYRFDLLDNKALGTNGTAQFNQGEFPSGMLAATPFHHGGHTTDYENIHAFVIYALAKLIVNNPTTAASFGLNAVVADSIKKDCMTVLYNSIRDGSNGKAKPSPGINADEPYHGVFTSWDWGYNRYNMGIVTELFMYWDLTGDKNYYNIGMDNLNYNLGMNPWDISFVMGTGAKNLQHPHNRAANPEGYNAGGIPYKYQSPKGALMGGCKPSETLLDNWELYTNTETCIDFSSQFLIPAQMLAMDLPEDKEGPKFNNVNIFPEVTTALVTWITNEISIDTVFLLDAPNGKLIQTVPGTGLLKTKQITFAGLAPNTTYYIYFEGVDVRRNQTVDKNNGEFYKFTTKSSLAPAQITGVKVCNETDESALITWWTRNGEYSSQVDYGKTKTLGLSKSPDDTRLPTLFHQVTLHELDPATLYYFQTLSGTIKDDNGGNMYTLHTSEVLVNYTIRIKPTNKAASGSSTHFYIDVSNNEPKAYTGLELRFYFTASAATAGTLVAQGFDKQMFDAGGMAGPLLIDYKSPVLVTGTTDQWYFPIILKSTLPVSGRARFELQINSGGSGFGPFPFSNFKTGWSIRPHTHPPDPVAFEGVDLSKGETGVYTGPEMIEKVNGEPIVSYVEDPYITAYYNGVHVFGYGPDFVADPLKIKRTATLSLTTPVTSPLDRFDLRQIDGTVTLSGKAAVSPDGRIDQIILNGQNLSESELSRGTSGSVDFTHKVVLTEGTNVFDIIAWDTTDCAIDAKKLVINWKKGPALTPERVARPSASPPGSAAKDSLEVQLVTTTKGAAIWYTLDGKDPVPGAPGALLYAGPILIRGHAVLKALASKPEFLPSEILTETYEVFPFHVINPLRAEWRDDNADGYADNVILILDTVGGAPDPKIAAAQVTGIRITGGFSSSGCVLSNDSVRCNLTPNTVDVINLKDSLQIPSPVANADGMLRPGSYPILDKVAPVLRRAVLHRGIVGQPDTLVAVFSEKFLVKGLSGSLLNAKHNEDGTLYSFELMGGTEISSILAKTLLPGLKGREAGYLFVVKSTPRTSSVLSLPPQIGDSLWINILIGLDDSIGNEQVNPENIRVALRISTPLQISVESATPGGMGTVPRIPIPQRWIVYAGNEFKGIIGDPPNSLPTLNALPPGTERAGGILIESSHPFSIVMHVHDNLGHFVSKVNLTVGEKDFSSLPPGLKSGTKKVYLLWNGTADNGGNAAMGAYVYVWTLVFHPTEGPAQSTSAKRIFGLMRLNK